MLRACLALIVAAGIALYFNVVQMSGERLALQDGSTTLAARADAFENGAAETALTYRPSSAEEAWRARRREVGPKITAWANLPAPPVGANLDAGAMLLVYLAQLAETSVKATQDNTRTAMAVTSRTRRSARSVGTDPGSVRILDSQTGRFLTRAPIGTAG